MIQFKKTVLDNGITVVSEFHSQSKAVSLGIWVETGTRDEAPDEAGISHFLEHLVFKGTKTKTAYQIAKSLEALGGELNAFTTREHTCYHCLVLKDHWLTGMDVLSDLVSNMSLNKTDFDLEKSVILQEIAMSDDSVEELVYDLYFEKTYKNHPLGRSILGTENSISKMTQKKIYAYYKKYYSGNNLVVSAAGCIDHQDLVESVKGLLSAKTKKRGLTDRKKPSTKPFRLAVDKTSEQIHVLIGMPATSFKDKFRFEAYIVNALLGGGMTSKLYQQIREKRGLVYSVYSSLNTFTDAGLINVYAACDQKNLKQLLKSIHSEFKRLKKQGVSEHDVELFKTQVIGSIMLGADDIDNRMQSIAINEMVFGKYKPVEEIVEEIKKVTRKSVNEFVKKYLNNEHLGILLMGADATKYSELIETYDFKF